MLFQLLLTNFSKSELSSCLQKVDHMTNYCKGLFSLFLVTVPEVFAKPNSAQSLSSSSCRNGKQRILREEGGHAPAVIASKFSPACQILLECRVLQVFHLDPSEIN